MKHTCGFPRDEAMDPNSGIDYRAEWLLCKACETEDAERKRVQDNTNTEPVPSGHRLALVPYRLNGEVRSG